ncbi:hypothetical protein F2Q70_00012592 [Brassica cretica]|uniref:Uncharacterized protein n=1 Tax=Brassica cretica TaxID=69181 RepID=A0A8S9LZW0_BRACR|nr:hypothetical protein F2Q70_00012592 [Brassica cretica]
MNFEICHYYLTALSETFRELEASEIFVGVHSVFLQWWQLKNYHPNPNVRNNPQLFWPKQDKPVDPAQSNQESEQRLADQADERNTEPALETSSPGPEQPNEAVCPIPEAVPPREYIPKVPYPVPARATHDALHAQLYEGIDLRKNIRGERVHDGFQGVQRSAS